MNFLTKSNFDTNDGIKKKHEKMSLRQFDRKKLCLMGIDDDVVESDLQDKCLTYGKLVDFYRSRKACLAFAEYKSEE